MKYRILTIALLVIASLAACTPPAQPAAPQVAERTPTTVRNAGEEAQVREVVENFGEQLKLVSLLSPNAAEDIQKQYVEFVSPALLETWMNDVPKAPGRMVSSPWPERIEISSIAEEAPDKYVIDGFVIEITSTEVANGEAANRIPVHMVVERDQARWLITEYTEG